MSERRLCGQCGREFKTKRAGICVIETLVSSEPYRLWQADILTCGCGNRLVVTALSPYIQAHEPGFSDELERVAKKPDTIIWPEK